MPIYEYQCQECAHEFEEIQGFQDDPIRECPQCHQSTVQKVVSQTAFHLKGGGWYNEGYGTSKGGDSSSKAGNNKASSNSEKSSSSSSSSNSSSSESKSSSTAS